jgi:predicted RNA binding protein with dsRBD fold (UPF0201 family)
VSEPTEAATTQDVRVVDRLMRRQRIIESARRMYEPNIVETAENCLISAEHFEMAAENYKFKDGVA